MRWIFLERIDELVPGERIRGVTRWPADLELFDDHFPGWPVVPGVLVMESLAQLAGKAIGYTVRQQRGDWPFPILSMMHNVKFRRFVRPDQEVVLEAEFMALRDESASMKVRARVDGKITSQAEQIFVFNAVPLQEPGAAKRLEDVEGAELKRLWSGFDAGVWSA
ncbi:MAG: 3-hydroxyacyl-[acyl-carrier-protein] dehydratase [Kiritimatiellia bacterium]|jgi:3-hydroxyacyl-[acyl-carrier-protein] dehydratase